MPWYAAPAHRVVDMPDNERDFETGDVVRRGHAFAYLNPFKVNAVGAEMADMTDCMNIPT